MTEDDIRRRWLARLGQTIDLDFAFFAVDDAFPLGPGRTAALGDLGAGRVAAGDALEAVGVGPVPVAVRVERVERPAPDGAGVVAVETGAAGETLALVVAHAPDAAVVPGSCLAPPGRLVASAAVEADVWVLPAAEMPGSPGELRRVLRAAAEGEGLELFFHTRPVAARATREWRPELGAEYRVGFALAHPVALYAGTRFALRYEGLTFGAGVVESAGR